MLKLVEGSLGTLKQDLEDKLKGLALAGVDIIFVKDRYLFDRLSKMPLPLPKGSKPIHLCFVNELDDIKALSHQDMRKLGWVREEKVKFG